MRFLHTMLRTGDLDRAIEFYTTALGMTLLRRQDYPSGQFTLAFLGFGPEAEGHVLELTYNWGRERYDLGDAFGHLAIAVPDIGAACDRVRAAGGRVVREPGPMKFTATAADGAAPPRPPTVIAFLEDPDGYKVELIERA